MTALMTGSTGFIGRRMIDRLVGQDFEVVALVRSGSSDRAREILGERPRILEDPGSTEGLSELLGGFHISAVVHLAALFRSSHTSADIELLVESNITFGLRVAEVVATSWPGATFLNVGTIYQHFNSASFDPVSLYAATKQALQDILAYYSAIDTLDVRTVVLPDAYGPGDTRKKIISLLVEALATGRPLDATRGSGILDLVHVDDVVEGLLQALEPGLGPGRWAISSGSGLRVRDLAEILGHLAGRPVPLRWGVLPERRRGITQLIHVAPLVPGWRPHISLEDGLRDILIDAGLLPSAM